MIYWQIEVLQAEVVALKQLVLTSTPSSPNKHLHPQIAATMSTEKEKPKSSKPFWKTHRRSTSHHEFTKEARQEVEAQQEAKADRCKEVRAKCFIQSRVVLFLVIFILLVSILKEKKYNSLLFFFLSASNEWKF